MVYSEKGRISNKYASKKTAKLKANLKNFFAPEPSCKVHGAATNCVLGKAPKFSKKAEYVFKIINNN